MNVKIKIESITDKVIDITKSEFWESFEKRLKDHGDSFESVLEISKDFNYNDFPLELFVRIEIAGNLSYTVQDSKMLTEVTEFTKLEVSPSLFCEGDEIGLDSEYIKNKIIEFIKNKL